jgi:uncharacterized SAM-binding protein YcdF (DUF218 family)
LPASKFIRQRYLWPALALVIWSGFLLREYENVMRPKSQSAVQGNFDCAVVLTGGAGRVREGFDLLARRETQKLIISGVNENSHLREIMPQWPFYGDLNEKDVILDRRSQTTYGNAQQSLPIVEALRCREVLLITSELHMWRAYRTFLAAYPETLTVIPWSVSNPRSETGLFEIMTEVLKSQFYSVWAY